MLDRGIRDDIWYPYPIKEEMLISVSAASHMIVAGIYNFFLPRTEIVGGQGRSYLICITENL